MSSMRSVYSERDKQLPVMFLHDELFEYQHAYIIISYVISLTNDFSSWQTPAQFSTNSGLFFVPLLQYYEIWLCAKCSLDEVTVKGASSHSWAGAPATLATPTFTAVSYQSIQQLSHFLSWACALQGILNNQKLRMKNRSWEWVGGVGYVGGMLACLWGRVGDWGKDGSGSTILLVQLY